MHLRGGRVARGGIRWSDRREDFRTEVLGLMKAQMVKNAVIVPVGAKGGFVVKQPPRGDVTLGRRSLAATGRHRGMLDVTDNLVGGDVVALPPWCVTTATTPTSSSRPTRAPRRSPTSPTRSPEIRVLAGRRLRVGRLAGYDHKKMGITARGAWE